MSKLVVATVALLFTAGCHGSLEGVRSESIRYFPRAVAGPGETGYLIVAKENVQETSDGVHIVSTTPHAVVAFTGVSGIRLAPPATDDSVPEWFSFPRIGGEADRHRIQVDASRVRVDDHALDLADGDLIILAVSDTGELSKVEHARLPEALVEPVFLQGSVELLSHRVRPKAR